MGIHNPQATGLARRTMGGDVWRVRGFELSGAARTLVMGILNVTPDSFSDGGRFSHIDTAIAAGEQMVSDGADLLDIGGESTRPGREETVDVEAEWARIGPVLDALRKRLPKTPLSVDTYKAEVARRALAQGADIINDVYALRRSPEIAHMAAKEGAGVLLVHMQGAPMTMQQAPSYRNVLVELKDMLKERMSFAISCGVPEECIAVDPGIGFGKTVEQNVTILGGLEYLRLLQRPICLGVSRKGFLGKLTGGLSVDDREEATIAANCAGILNGASIVRVHNVVAARRALAVIDAVKANQ